MATEFEKYLPKCGRAEPEWFGGWGSTQGNYLCLVFENHQNIVDVNLERSTQFHINPHFTV